MFSTDSGDQNGKSKKPEKDAKKPDEADAKPAKFTFKGTAKAISLAQRLSPKIQRKKEPVPSTSQLKV